MLADWSEFEDHMDMLLSARLIQGTTWAGRAARLRQKAGRPGGPSAGMLFVADGEAAHG